MSLLQKMFGRGKKPIEEVSVKNHRGKESESAIEQMKRRLKEQYGSAMPFLPPSGEEEELTKEEEEKILKKIFPRTTTNWRKEIESVQSVFPPSPEKVAKEGLIPTMDAAVPNGVYPPMNGKHVAIQDGGMALMADPLLRFPINPRVLKHFQSRIWITYNGCAIIAMHEFVNRACAIPAQEAIAHGYKLECASRNHEHNGNQDLEEGRFLFDLKETADKMGLNDVCYQLNYKKKVFGVAIAVPRVEFKEDAKSPIDEDKPYSYADEYDPNMIKPGSYQGFSVIDPIWLTYEFDSESSDDPMSPHFYEPTWYRTQTRKIHRSWCIRVVNSEVPDILKPVYYFGGLSLTQMIYERVWAADKLANEAPLLAMTKRLLIADGNLDQLIADPNHSNRFFKAINYFRDNFSIFIKKPSSNVTQLDTSLAELTSLTMSQYQLVAAIAQIPVTKLMKNVPSGLQSTGDYEWDDYAQSLMEIQRHDYTPLLNRHYELYLKSNYPDKDYAVHIDWNPIDVPKESEVISMASNIGSTINQLFNGKLITADEARSILRKSGLSIYQSINPKLPDLIKKLEEQAGQPKEDVNGENQQQGEQKANEMAEQQQQQQQQPHINERLAINDRIFKEAVMKVLSEAELKQAPTGQAAMGEGGKNPQQVTAS